MVYILDTLVFYSMIIKFNLVQPNRVTRTVHNEDKGVSFCQKNKIIIIIILFEMQTYVLVGHCFNLIFYLHIIIVISNTFLRYRLYYYCGYLLFHSIKLYCARNI